MHIHLCIYIHTYTWVYIKTRIKLRASFSVCSNAFCFLSKYEGGGGEEALNTVAIGAAEEPQ